MKVKYAAAQGEIANLQEELRGAKGGAREVIANGQKHTGVDVEELEKLQSEKDKASADLEAAMVELEEKAKVMVDLQAMVRNLKSKVSERIC